MSKYGDYVPSREAELVNWIDNFVDKIQANASKWQMPQEEVSKLTGLRDDFKQKHAKCAGPDRTRTLVQEKDAAKKAAIAYIRATVRFRFANPAITDAELVDAGLHPRNNPRTQLGEPRTMCIIARLSALGGCRVEIRYHDEGTPDSRAVPYGYNGGLIRYNYGIDRINNYAMLTQSVLMTVNPFVLQLPLDAEAQFLSVTSAWQSDTGKVSKAWSEIQHVAVS